MFETVLGRLQARELRAYAAGIALVYDQLTDTREGAFAATAAEENLWRWLTVRGLLPGIPYKRPAKSCWRGGKCPGAIFFL